MQALAAVWPHIGPVGRLVVPGLVGIAGFHRRNHVNKAGMLAASLDRLGDNVFLADVALGDVLDGDAGLHSLGVAHPGKRPRHHHSVIAGQNAGNPLVIAFRQ
jgi:hypothetical protein